MWRVGGFFEFTNTISRHTILLFMPCPTNNSQISENTLTELYTWYIFWKWIREKHGQFAYSDEANITLFYKCALFCNYVLSRTLNLSNNVHVLKHNVTVFAI